jgi:hypothetical protein
MRNSHTWRLDNLMEVSWLLCAEWEFKLRKMCSVFCFRECSEHFRKFVLILTMCNLLKALSLPLPVFLKRHWILQNTCCKNSLLFWLVLVGRQSFTGFSGSFTSCCAFWEYEYLVILPGPLLRACCSDSNHEGWLYFLSSENQPCFC